MSSKEIALAIIKGAILPFLVDGAIIGSVVPGEASPACHCELDIPHIVYPEVRPLLACVICNLQIIIYKNKNKIKII